MKTRGYPYPCILHGIIEEAGDVEFRYVRDKQGCRISSGISVVVIETAALTAHLEII